MRKLSFCAVPLILSACAAVVQVGPAAPDGTPAVPVGAVTSAQIVVYRPASFGPITSVATSPEIKSNGQTMGRCRVGYPIRINVAPGEYDITAATSARDTLEFITVSAGETAYLRCGVTLTRAPLLVPVSVEKAESDLGL